MAVRVWREWLAASLVLVVGACSGKSGQHDVDPMGTGGATARGGSSSVPPGKMLPGQPTQPVGGSTVMGSAGEAPASGGRGGAGGSFAAGAGPELAGAGGAADDAPGIIVSAPGDHTVHESYGTMQVQLKLTAPPQASVKVDLVSSDPIHAVVYPLSLTFTPEDWEKAQIAIVVGVRDTIADGGNTVTIETRPAVSTDPRYSNVDALDVDVFVVDETDTGIVVGSIAGGGVTSENGATTTFYIVLNSQPTAPVTIPLSSSDPGEGSVPASVVFEPSDWNKPHQVTVTGVDDALSDGLQAYEIVTGPAVSDDPHYAGVDPGNVQLSNADNE
jgi:hypothetical protein